MKKSTSKWGSDHQRTVTLQDGIVSVVACQVRSRLGNRGNRYYSIRTFCLVTVIDGTVINKLTTEELERITTSNLGKKMKELLFTAKDGDGVSR